MHIPDGFLDIGTAATTCAISAGTVAYASKKVNKTLGEKQVPLMGVMAAFIFAAQMLNFPIIGGTSGHLIGAALAAVLLGPWAAVLIMTCVLIVQSLIFQDGGLLSLGANVLNMAIIASFTGYYFYRGITLIIGEDSRGRAAGSFIGAWASVFIASSACALELWISGTSPLSMAFPAMAGWHALIGIGEGLITTTVLSMVMATRADIVAIQKA